MLRIQSPLPEGCEEIVARIIGCCIAVHKTLGPGLLESIYRRALCIEMDLSGIAFEREKEIPVVYRDQLLCRQRLDIVAADQVVLELKAVDQLHSIHHAQLLSYLRASKFRIGLLVNFNVAVLRDGVRRVVL